MEASSERRVEGGGGSEGLVGAGDDAGEAVGRREGRKRRASGVLEKGRGRGGKRYMVGTGF